MEQEALDIIGPSSRRDIENGEAGGRVPHGLSHYLGLTGQMLAEPRDLMEEAPSPALCFQYNSREISISDGRDSELEESVQGELFSNGEQEPDILERTVEEADGYGEGSDSSYAEEHTDADLSGPDFKRKIFHVHHQLLEALDSLSRSCLTLSESIEDSASILCGVLPQGISTLQSTMEQVASSVEAVARSPAQEPAAPALASLIEAQTGAIQILACTISSGLERLGTRIDQGFGQVTDLLQAALPRLGSVSAGPVRGAPTSTSRDTCPSAPSPHRQVPTALEAAVILQSEIKPPRARALRDRRL
ncbi:uncharacterized protein LOC119974667 [Scyliorhinus canicula]|uniref:uncharacterized protein LOC119974667 n=1 Tax=Scyliorhinus canicula TaxID=7830 RepID=UPI0018F71345|nr:uncharacterized protein LOC119974667 [Scyliorhinus canicula]